MIGTAASATTSFTFRIMELQDDSRNGFSSDYGNPILVVM
jgi:hypothetical protein